MSQKYSVFWTNSAEKDLERIVDYIIDDSPRDAKKIYSKIRAEAAQLSNYPERGRVVPELLLHGIRQYRELIMPPWRILYHVVDKNVYILIVMDSRQNIEDVLLQKLTDSN